MRLQKIVFDDITDAMKSMRNIYNPLDITKNKFRNALKDDIFRCNFSLMVDGDEFIPKNKEVRECDLLEKMDSFVEDHISGSARALKEYAYFLPTQVTSHAVLRALSHENPNLLTVGDNSLSVCVEKSTTHNLVTISVNFSNVPKMIVL